MVYQIIRKLLWIYFKIFNRVELIGAEKLPTDGAYMICANHKSYGDPLLIASQVKRPVHFMAKKELFDNKIIGSAIKKFYAFPVDRGASDITAIKTALRVLKDGQILGVFPEGTRVKEINYENGKAGVIMIAHKAKVKIVPMYIEGSYVPFKKLKLYVREVMDLSDLPKQSQLEYKDQTVNLIKTIYSGVDIYRNNSSK